MDRFDYRGMGVALITPFRADGSLDLPALNALVDRLVKAGVDYMVVLGTTAETPTLTIEERNAVRAEVSRSVGGRIPLVLGAGGNCTRSLTEELKAWDGNGYQAILSVVPFYNKPNQEGIYRHFKAVAEASPVDVLLYNVPGRTGSNMLPSTAVRLARECSNIVGVKEASGSVEQVKAIVKDAPDDFAVISGDDGLTLEFMEEGARGVISVIGNAAPTRWCELVRLAQAGRHDDARKLEDEMLPLLKMLFAEGNPVGIKGLMGAMGLVENSLRLPLVRTSDALQSEIEEFCRLHPHLLK